MKPLDLLFTMQTFGKKISLYAVALIQLSWGLLIHPYQSIYSLLEKKRYQWLILLPSLIFLVVKICWLLIIVPITQLFFSCSTNYFFGCRIIAMFANWFSFFFIMWQVMLLYLAVRIARARK